MVVPQYLGRVDFVLRLEHIATRCGAGFIEVVLEADRTAALQRFRSRRQDLLRRAEQHPEADVDDEALEEAIADAIDRLERILQMRPTAMTIAAGGSLEQTYAALLAALDAMTL